MESSSSNNAHRRNHSTANGQLGHSAVQHRALLLCNLLAATRQFSVLTGQKMRLTSWHNGNKMRNTICVDK